ncbi:MAG: hypothetical protein ACXVJD_08485 [Mucilaginibacter sp.]
MKKLTILSAIALSGLIYNAADAQVRLQVGLNLGRHVAVYASTPVVVEQPVYQQDVVYNDSDDDDYYYLPDVDAYYNVNARCYYYNDGYNWIPAAYLPGAYRNYDWRSARRYEVRGYRPYMHNDVYRSRYNGREIAEWRNHNHEAFSRNNDRFDRRGGFNRPEVNRRDDNRFDNRGGGFNRPEQGRNDNHYGNRGQGGFGQPNPNFGGRDRGQGQPSNQNGRDQNRDNRNQGSYGQPNQNTGGRDRGQDQPSNQNGRDQNRGQGGYGQPNQNNGGRDRGQGRSAQPSNQNSGRQNNDNRGNERFARDGQSMGQSHRGARF